MDISRNNYESWFLDYLDGNLDARQVEILMSFLDFNPDLKVELEAVKNAKLEPEDHHYDLKYSLRKPTGNPNISEIELHFEEYCISSIEMQLSPTEENLLRGFIEKDQERQTIYNLYLATRLRADKTILFPRKSGMKKKFINIPAVRLFIATAAAIVLIMLALSWFLRDQGIVSTPGQVMTENQQKIQETSTGNAKENISDLAEVRKTVQENTKPVIVKKMQENQQIPELQFQVREKIRLARLESIQSFGIEIPDIATNAVSARTFQNKGYKYLSQNEIGNLEDRGSMLENRTEKKLSLWRLADAGIKRINSTTEENYSLDRVIDEEGRTRRLTFETPLFGISAPLQNANNSQ